MKVLFVCLAVFVGIVLVLALARDITRKPNGYKGGGFER